MDDFSQDELGEFPGRWSLAIGTFEVAEMGGERWLRCTANDGTIRMKLPKMEKLPEFWTLEFDFYGTEPMGSALTVRGVNERGDYAWEASYPQGTDLAFRSGDIFSTTPLEGATAPAGRHHVMFMARGPALKVYMDRQRMASVPDISAPAGLPSQFEFRLWASTGPMITNVRFAEGAPPAKDVFESGKFVTHGIHFSTGSDAVLPESAPVLRQIASYLEANPAARLRIVGYTDNVGSAASNLDLSKRRAASVAAVLSQQFGIAPSRFETEGKGDAQPLAPNATPEGRAMNRRVEFDKL
jgi:outer membrane protein OmpA-like peptidoglycan-associated protein